MTLSERISYLEQEIATSTAELKSLFAEKKRIIPILEKAKHITPFDLGSIRVSYDNKIERTQNRLINARSELAWIKRGGKKI